MCFLHSICGALGLLVTSVKFLLSSGMLLAQKNIFRRQGGHA